MLFDILIISILIVSVLLCINKGFSISLFNSLSSVISIILVSVLNKPVTFFVKNTKFGNNFYDALNRMFYENYVTSTNELKNLEKLPEFLIKPIDVGVDTTADVIKYLTDKTYDIIVFIVSFIIVLLLVKLIVKLLPVILKTTTKIPVIKQIDKFAGFCFGIITGCICCVIFVNLLSVISVCFEIEYVTQQLSDSILFSFVNKLNLNLFTI